MTATQTRVAAAPLGRSRSRVLEQLQLEDEPVGVVVLSERLGLHQNTTRFHLDALVEAGLAERHAEDSHRPGRPRALYRAVPDNPVVGRRNYYLLAEILAGHLATHDDDPARTALLAGREWGRGLIRRPAMAEPVEAGESVRQVSGVLADAGFRPRALVTDERPRLELRHCPFRELAVKQSDVVCSVHLGVIQGMFDELDAPVQATRTSPFAEPALCIIDLGPRSRRQ